MTITEKMNKACELAIIAVRLPPAEYELFKILGLYVVNDTPELRSLMRIVWEMADRRRPRLIEMK